jgi:GNAT superfamily N-acetyltransferase
MFDLRTADRRSFSKQPHNVHGTEPAPSHVVVARDEAGSVALLRSLAVASEFRGQGLGTALVAHAEAAAGSRGVAELFLLATSARGFSAERGCQEVPMSSAPLAIVTHPQFTTLRPSSATVTMRRHVATHPFNRNRSHDSPRFALRLPAGDVHPALRPAWRRQLPTLTARAD